MDKDTVYTKVTFGSSNQKDALQGRVWLVGTPNQIKAELKAKGFEVIEKRPSRAIEKAPKAKKASKKASKKEAVAA